MGSRRKDHDEWQAHTPCYVISSNGFKDRVSYQEEPDFGRYIGMETPYISAHQLIHRDIREHWDRNGSPVFFVSDHGNSQRIRTITLRSRRPTLRVRR